MDVVCLDLEGVLVPEIWIQFAQVTGIDAFRIGTIGHVFPRDFARLISAIEGCMFWR